jgi:hypothetical protein
MSQPSFYSHSTHKRVKAGEMTIDARTPSGHKVTFPLQTILTQSH